jgi:hypothetical protein
MAIETGTVGDQHLSSSAADALLSRRFFVGRNLEKAHSSHSTQDRRLARRDGSLAGSVIHMRPILRRKMFIVWRPLPTKLQKKEFFKEESQMGRVGLVGKEASLSDSPICRFDRNGQKQSPLETSSGILRMHSIANRHRGRNNKDKAAPDENGSETALEPHFRSGNRQGVARCGSTLAARTQGGVDIETRSQLRDLFMGPSGLIRAISETWNSFEL